APPQWRSGARHMDLEKAKVLAQLDQTPSRHLVIIRGDGPYLEWWVQNLVDIDVSRVVRARELAPENNQQLLGCYPDRQVWLFRPVDWVWQLTLCPGSPCKRAGTE